MLFRSLKENEILREGDQRYHFENGVFASSRVWEEIPPWMIGLPIGSGGRHISGPFRRPIDPLIESLVNALAEALDAYKGLVDSGDCGNWEPEEEPWYVACREQLRRGRESL